MKNTLYIVDDHNMVRNGLKAWLENHSEWHVEKDFATSAECLKCLECIGGLAETDDSPLPEIIIIDVQLINETGFNLVKKISKK